MSAPKPKKTLLDLAKEPPPAPIQPPKPPQSMSDPSSSSSMNAPSKDQGDLLGGKDAKSSTDKKSPFDRFKKDKSKEGDLSKDQSKSSDSTKPSGDADKKSKASNENDKEKGILSKIFGKSKDNKNQEVKPESDARKENKPDQEAPKTSDKIVSEEPKKHEHPPSTSQEREKQDLPKKEDTPINPPTQSETLPKKDEKYPMPPSSGDDKSQEKPKEAKPKIEEKKKGGFFGNLFGKEEKEEPKKEETGPKKPEPKVEEEEKEDLIPEAPAASAGGDNDASKSPEEDPLISKEEVKRDGKGDVVAPSDEEKKNEGTGKDPVEDKSKYPLPIPDEKEKLERPTTEPEDTKPAETKPENKKEEKTKPEKKSGGFFGNFFGKEDEEPKKEAEKKVQEPSKEPEKGGGGIFGGLFKKEPKQEEDRSKTPKEEKSGFFGFFKKDKEEDSATKAKAEEAPAENYAKEEEEKGQDEEANGEVEKVEVEMRDAEEAEEPGFVVEEVERVPIKKIKNKKTRRPDVEDEFESGDAYLVMRVGPPHSKSLIVNPKIYSRYGGLLSTCERSLGIIPGRFAEHHEKKADPEATRGIYVWGLVPRGPADKAGVQLGDWIVSIDDKIVDSNNFQEVVRGVENNDKVHLKLQKVLLQFDSSLKPPKHPRGADSDGAKHRAVVTSISGNSVDSRRSFFDDHPHCVLFLKSHIRSKDLQEFDAKEDVVYCYPDNLDNKLVDFRGSFLTLQSLIPYLTGSQVESTTLEHGNRKIVVFHHPVNNGLLLIFLPSKRFPDSQLRQYSNDIKRLIELLFCSIERAFSDPSNRARLDRLFSNAFASILSPGDEGSSFGKMFNRSIFREEFFESSPGVRSIIVDQNIKMHVDNHLSDFEAESFGNMSEDYYGSRKLFDILGSSFYHKGYLITSHIPCQLMSDTNTILKYSNYLGHGNSEQLGHSYLWMEVFFERCKSSTEGQEGGRFTKDVGRFDVYRRFESDNHRNFVLALSAENSVLVALLSCSKKSFDLIGRVPCVDFFLLNRLKFTLAQLTISGITRSIEHTIQWGGGPSIASVEEFLSKPKSEVVGKITNKIKNLFKRNKNEQKVALPSMQNSGSSQSDLSDPKANLSRQMSDSHLYLKAQFEESEKFNEDEFDAGDDDDPWRDGKQSSQQFSTNLIDKTSPSKLQLNKISDFTEAASQPLPATEHHSIQINAGSRNTVFNYAFIDDANNIIITPPQQQVMSQPSLTQAEVMAKFNESCSLIREFFDKTQDIFGGPVHEYGVLFRCNRFNFRGSNKDSDQQLSYWVVGRKTKNTIGREGEFYVCFNDSAQQNIVEMAFKLMHGVSLP